MIEDQATAEGSEQSGSGKDGKARMSPKSLKLSMLENLINAEEMIDTICHDLSTSTRIRSRLWLLEELYICCLEMQWANGFGFLRKVWFHDSLLGPTSLYYLRRNCVWLTMGTGGDRGVILRGLRLSVERVDAVVMGILNENGANLEYLEISYKERSTDFLSGHYPKLKTLALTMTSDASEPSSPLELDLGKFRDTLETVQLRSERLGRRLVASLSGLTKLKTLSLSECLLVDEGEWKETFEGFRSMETMRSLDLSGVSGLFSVPAEIFAATIDGLTNLKNVDLSRSRVTRNQLLELKRTQTRLLNTLSIFEIEDVENLEEFELMAITARC